VCGVIASVVCDCLLTPSSVRMGILDRLPGSPSVDSKSKSSAHRPRDSHSRHHAAHGVDSGTDGLIRARHPGCPRPRWNDVPAYGAVGLLARPKSTRRARPLRRAAPVRVRGRELDRIDGLRAGDSKGPAFQVRRLFSCDIPPTSISL
jgi:hypothetical protein